MAKININTPQQQQQLSGKDNITKRLPAKGTAIMRYTNNTHTITVTTATTTTTTTTTARAMANQCMATRWPTATTTRTTTSTTTSASSATMYRKHSNNSHTRWPSGRGCCGGGGGGVTQMKLPWLLLLLITTTTATHATAENGAQETHGSWGGPQAARSNHSRAPTKYSQPLLASSADNDDSFRPIIPKDISPEYISRNVFTETGQYRVFQPVDSDLRVAAAVGYKVGGDNEPLDSSKATTEHTTLQPVNAMAMATASTTIATSSEKLQKQRATTTTRIRKANTTPALRVTKTAKVQSGAGTTKEMQPPVELRAAPAQAARKHEPAAAPPAGLSNALNSEMKGLEELLVEYVENFFNKGQYEPLPGLVFALQKNHTDAAAVAATMTAAGAGNRKKRPTRHLGSTSKLAAANADGSISINIPRAIESGRLFFFSGLKKALWPIFMGLQILKSLLFAMFLPTLIGSFGKLLGKGIISGSSPLFIRPAEAPQDLDFRDNTFNFDDDNKFGMNDGSDKDEAYAYNQAEASQTQNQYVYNPAAINQQALSRYGNEQNKMQDSYLSALQSISSASFKNSNSISGSSSAGAGGGGGGLGAPLRTKPASPANTYQTFQKVPASSLLLSNYDPFYSPLLSRLDSVFAQLKLNSESESCREKLICLMYANPAKYAPYSNLVSAQLSRELNELRKPTSDNPDILRFFKYMRAAKDGQDGVDCEKSFDRCKEFKDFENPAMVSTYHDINKLVQARKLA